jgi:competence protein ComFC
MTTSIRRIGRMAAAVVLEVVYPKVCAGCGMRGVWLCNYCDSTVPSCNLPISCPRCGVPSLRGRCGCADLDPLVACARSAFVYSGWTSTAVKRLKYQGESSRADHLALHMAPLLSSFGHVEALIPVPLHASKEKQRGYNQSTLLAEEVRKLTGVPVLPVLRRTRKTISQTSLSGHDRKLNVAGVFERDATWIPHSGGRYVLIDDVRTTGSTLNACVEALRPLQPAMIGALTFALDMHRDRLTELREYQAGVSSGMAPTP